MATPLPMPAAGSGDFSPDGSQMVYSLRTRDFRSEKRCGGGQANTLYIYDLKTTDARKFPKACDQAALENRAILWQVIGFITSFELYVYGIAYSFLGGLENREINNYNGFRCENLGILHDLQPRQKNLIILLVILTYNLIFALTLRIIRKDLP